jgi:RNA polymerase sigma-70 factor, ECF subfamily
MTMIDSSKIDLMKNRKTGVVETIQADTDSAGFETLFQEHWGNVYRLLYRLVGDPAEAEDLALEAFLRLYKHDPRNDGTFNIGGWLRRVATNLGLHSIRSWKRREQYELNAGRFALEQNHAEHPAEALARQDEQHLVRLALARMNERQSQLLILRHSGLAYKEIAEALKLASTSIGPLLLRAEREFERHYRALAQEEG